MRTLGEMEVCNGMKAFILGVILGIFVVSIFYYTPFLNPKLRLELGMLLDRDTYVDWDMWKRALDINVRRIGIE